MTGIDYIIFYVVIGLLFSKISAEHNESTFKTRIIVFLGWLPACIIQLFNK